MKEFRSFWEAAAHVVRQSVALDAAIESSLEDIGRHVESKIKGKFGKYQPAAGNYPEWKELNADWTQPERERLGYPRNEPLLREGGLRSSISYKVDEGATEDSVTIGSVSQIVFFHEVGYWNHLTGKFVEPRATHGPALIEETPVIKSKLAGAVATGMVVGRTSWGAMRIHSTGVL